MSAASALVLEQLHQADQDLGRGGRLFTQVWLGAGSAQPHGRVIPSGLPALDARLALGGLPGGAVTELCARPGHGGLSVAMHICAAQLSAHPQALAAVVDGASMLHAPAVLAAGVPAGRLWCVRPRQPEDAAAVSLRLLRAGVFSVVVVDHLTCPPPRPELAVRRMGAGALEAGAVVVLLTGDWVQALPAPLPSALRLGLGRLHHQHLQLTVDKQRGAEGGAIISLPWPPELPTGPRGE